MLGYRHRHFDVVVLIHYDGSVKAVNLCSISIARADSFAFCRSTPSSCCLASCPVMMSHVLCINFQQIFSGYCRRLAEFTGDLIRSWWARHFSSCQCGMYRFSRASRLEIRFFFISCPPPRPRLQRRSLDVWPAGRWAQCEITFRVWS